jgi:hypothetical protein
MKAAFSIVLAFSAMCIYEAAREPEPRPWGERMCDGHGGLRRDQVGPHGEITAVCNDGCRHLLSPSINDRIGRKGRDE